MQKRLEVPLYVREQIRSLRATTSCTQMRPEAHATTRAPVDERGKEPDSSTPAEQPPVATSRVWPLAQLDRNRIRGAVLRLEEIVPRLGIVDETERALCKVALEDAYALDLVDRMLMRVYLVHEGLRRLTLFDGARDAAKYDRSMLVQLCRRHSIELTEAQAASTAALCERLGRAHIVEHVPTVRVHLNQAEVDRFLARVFVPLERLRPAAMHTRARYIAYVNDDHLMFDERGQPRYRDGHSFLSDLVRVVEGLQVVPAEEVRSLLEAHAHRHGDPRALVFLMNAVALLISQNVRRLCELACHDTAGKASDFLWSELKNTFASGASKNDLCSLAIATANTR